jgi:hypothetical protein
MKNNILETIAAAILLISGYGALLLFWIAY